MIFVWIALILLLIRVTVVTVEHYRLHPKPKPDSTPTTELDRLIADVNVPLFEVVEEAELRAEMEHRKVYGLAPISHNDRRWNKSHKPVLFDGEEILPGGTAVCSYCHQGKHPYDGTHRYTPISLDAGRRGTA